MLTQEYIKKLFYYSSETGHLIWKVARSNIIPGQVAGYIKADGYLHIKVDGKQYLAHRLVFLYHYGYLSDFIDHRNRDPIDNRIENLRAATNSLNQGNRTKQKNNTSGWKGVFWEKQQQEWRAQIRVTGKRKHLGYFSNPEDGAMAYNAAALEHFGEFAYLNEHPLNHM